MKILLVAAFLANLPASAYAHAPYASCCVDSVPHILGMNLACIDNSGFAQRREDIQLTLTPAATKAGIQYSLAISGNYGDHELSFSARLSKRVGDYDVSGKRYE